MYYYLEVSKVLNRERLRALRLVKKFGAEDATVVTAKRLALVIPALTIILYVSGRQFIDRYLGIFGVAASADDLRWDSALVNSFFSMINIYRVFTLTILLEVLSIVILVLISIAMRKIFLINIVAFLAASCIGFHTFYASSLYVAKMQALEVILGLNGASIFFADQTNIENLGKLEECDGYRGGLTLVKQDDNYLYVYSICSGFWARQEYWSGKSDDIRKSFPEYASMVCSDAALNGSYASDGDRGTMFAIPKNTGSIVAYEITGIVDRACP